MRLLMMTVLCILTLAPVAHASLDQDASPAPPVGAAPQKEPEGWVSGMTGAELLSFCGQTVRVFDQKALETDQYSTFCLGYVQGYTDGYVMAKGARREFCLPVGTTGEVLARTFVEKMQGKTADELKAIAVPLLQKALAEAYPCR